MRQLLASLAILLLACAERPAADPRVGHGATDTASATVAPAPRVPSPARDTSRFAGVVGIVSQARDYPTCLTIASDSLAAGATVLVVTPEPPQRVDTATIVRRRTAECTAMGDEWGSALIDGAAHYDVHFADSLQAGGPRIAVALPGAALSVRDGMVTGDLDADGGPERFHACTSREGAHHFVLTAGAPRWHAYWYVPYDTEPSCDGALLEASRTR